MTDIQKEIKEALEQVTDGEWVLDGFGSLTLKESGKFIATVFDLDDAHLIANAPTWLLHQQELIEQLQTKLKIATEALEMYADNDFYNWITDDVTDNAKEALSQLKGESNE